MSDYTSEELRRLLDCLLSSPTPTLGISSYLGIPSASIPLLQEVFKGMLASGLATINENGIASLTAAGHSAIGGVQHPGVN